MKKKIFAEIILVESVCVLWQRITGVFSTGRVSVTVYSLFLFLQ